MMLKREIDKCCNLEVLERESENAIRDCEFFNNCSICPLRYSDGGCTLRHLTKRKEIVEGMSEQN
jgi:hypothetical protein